MLGRLGGAVSAFEQAEAIASEVDDPFRHDAAAGRARAALASGDQATAIVEAERVWASYSADPKRLGAARPVLIQLTCWQVFELGGQPRAGEVLVSAHTFLQERAGMISDAASRQGFLRNIPEHRGIVDAWAGRDSGAPSKALSTRSP